MPKPLLHTALFHLPHHLSLALSHANSFPHSTGLHHRLPFFRWINERLTLMRYQTSRYNYRQKVIVAATVIGTPAAVLLTLFLLPKDVNYSFSGQNCFTNLVVLPSFVSPQNSSSYSVKTTSSVNILGYPFISSKSCVELNERPIANSQESAKLTILGVFSKNIKINTPALPQANISTDVSQPLSPKAGIHFKLDQADSVFSYAIQIQENRKICEVEATNISCQFNDFGLNQGESYELSLLQRFNDDEETTVSASITLRDPVIVTGSSISEGQKIFNKPDSVTFTANKPLKSVGSIRLQIGEQELGTSTSLNDHGLTISFNEPLPRQSGFTLTISGAEAEDGAYLPEPYVLHFSTSGGPIVTSTNIGSYDVSPSKSIVISFDSEVSQTQPLGSLAGLWVGNTIIDASVTSTGQTVTINPSQTLPACSPFTLRISEELQNSAGISGGSAWTYSSRTTCKQIFSVGTSVLGRDLTAYRFGSGSNTILFVGGMHGNEKSSYKTLIAWVDELEHYYERIPVDKTVIVIPDINPDAYAANSRLNANGIDINRNFPSNDWTNGVYIPGNIYLDNGGGTTPLSELESSALANFVNTANPRLVLTYHAVAKSVFANGSGDSSALAAIYAAKSGFAQYDSSHEDGIFNYPTTGEFEAWLTDKKSIPALLVELATLGGNELYSQRNAMWSMLSL